MLNSIMDSSKATCSNLFSNFINFILNQANNMWKLNEFRLVFKENAIIAQTSIAHEAAAWVTLFIRLFLRITVPIHAPAVL